MYLGGEIAAPPALVRMRLCSSEYFCNYLSEPLDILLRPSWVLVFRVLPFAHVGNVCNQCCWSDNELICCQFRPELGELVA